MAELTGMDIAQIAALASKMIVEAVALEVILTPISHKLEAAPWSGADRDRFVDEWRSQHVTPLTELTRSLREAAQQAQLYVEEQERASRSY